MEHAPETVLCQILEQCSPGLLKTAPTKDLTLCLQALAVVHRNKEHLTHHELRNRAVRSILEELRVKKRLSDCSPIDLTRISYALVRMGLRTEPSLWTLCRERALDELASFEGKECANLLWASAQLHPSDKVFLQAISKQAVLTWTSMGGKEKAMTLSIWGCLGTEFHSFVGDVLDVGFGETVSHGPLHLQHISNILLSLARMKFRRQTEPVENLVEKLLQRLKHESRRAQSLCSCIWALGQLQYQNRSHVHTLAQEITRPSNLEQLTSQGICHVLVGWAQMGLEDLESVELMAEEAVSSVRLPRFSLKELSLLNWSLGKLKLANRSLLDRLISATIQTAKLKQYDEKQLCTILKGWAWMSFRDHEPVQLLLRTAVSKERLQKYKTSEVAKLVWAVGTLRVQNDLFYQVLCEELRRKRRIATMQPSDVKQSLVGFQLGSYGKVAVAYFFRDVFEHWISSGKLGTIHEPDLKAIHSTLQLLPYVEPVLVHELGRELKRRDSSMAQI